MEKVDELMSKRQSARDFDQNFEISKLDLETIINAIRLAPTSYNLLNYRLLVFPKSNFRSQMAEMFYYQKNFVNASIYLLFVVKSGDTIKSETIYEVADLIFPKVELTEKKNKFIANFQQAFDLRFWNQPDLADAWSAKQAYVGAGVGTVAAASVGIDSCIQEGIDLQRLNSFLMDHNLIKNDEKAVLGLSLGKKVGETRSPKIRKSFEDFAHFYEGE